MATWWDMLEVARDVDLRAVKRAYAAKLKSIRQDEDPKGFMALRAAYDEAREHIRYREMETEDTVVRQEPFERDTDTSHDSTSIQDNIADSEWKMQGQDELIIADMVYTPTIVEQLMNEVHALIRSPWGAGRVDSWAAILDDERLDDIDAYSDFENAFLNYMLNIHGFFDEDTNVESKLNLAVAHLIFERFGWQSNRNSVHFNPVVYDWLADKFFQQNEDTPHGDLDEIDGETDSGANAKNSSHSQFNQRGQKKKPNPKTEKFFKWFDGNGVFYLFLTMIALMVLYYTFGSNS